MPGKAGGGPQRPALDADPAGQREMTQLTVDAQRDDIDASVG